MRGVIKGLKASEWQDIPEEQAYEAMCDWFSVIPPNYQTATYDELASTGQLQVITNKNLRRQLQGLKALLERFNIERATFWDIHQDLAGSFDPFVLFELDDRYFETIGCTYNFEAMAKNPEAVSALVELVGTHVVLVYFYTRELEALREIEQTLMNETGEGELE